MSTFASLGLVFFSCDIGTGAVDDYSALVLPADVDPGGGGHFLAVEAVSNVAVMAVPAMYPLPSTGTQTLAEVEDVSLVSGIKDLVPLEFPATQAPHFDASVAPDVWTWLLNYS